MYDYKERFGEDYKDNDYVSCQPNGEARGVSSIYLFKNSLRLSEAVFGKVDIILL